MHKFMVTNTQHPPRAKPGWHLLGGIFAAAPNLGGIWGFPTGVLLLCDIVGQGFLWGILHLYRSLLFDLDFPPVSNFFLTRLGSIDLRSGCLPPYRYQG